MMALKKFCRLLQNSAGCFTTRVATILRFHPPCEISSAEISSAMWSANYYCVAFVTGVHDDDDDDDSIPSVPDRPSPWAGVRHQPGMDSPPGVYDLPPRTPYGTANAYTSDGYCRESPVW